MTVLGYAKLVELLTGSDEYAFEGHMVALGRNGLTPFRFAALQALARKRRATVSGVLAAIGEPQGGGSYRAVADFFENLHAERLLSKEAVGRRTYWSFAAQHAQFAAFLERCIPPTARRRSS